MSAPSSSSTGCPASSTEAARDSAIPAAVVEPADGDRGNPPVFELNVKCIDGTTTKLEVPVDIRGSDLKELIVEQLSVPIDRQRLIFRGRVVKDEDLLGQHVTENGQTIHMVQRPQAPAPGEMPAAGEPEVRAPPGVGQVHFQISTDGGGLQQMAGMQQFDLSQILGSVLGAVGRGGAPPMQGIPRHPPPFIPQQPAAPGTAPASGAEQPGGGSASAASAGTGDNANLLESLRNERSYLESLRTERSLLLESLRSDGAAAPPPTTDGGAAVDANQAGVAGVQMQPLQIVFQQAGGLGNLASILPGMLGEVIQNDMNPTDGQDARGGHADQLPWRDLRRLHQHLSRLLGRPHTSRGALPPANMQLGSELSTFLSALLSATSQLSVSISDLQASLADGVGPLPRQRLQFAMALVAAARTFRGMATSMQSGALDFPHSQSAATTADASTAPPADTSASHASSPTWGPSMSRRQRREERRAREARETPSLAPEMPSAGASGDSDGRILTDSSGTEIVGSTLEGADVIVATSILQTDGSPPDAEQMRAQAAQMSQMLPQLFAQMSQAQPAAATPSAVPPSSSAPGPANATSPPALSPPMPAVDAPQSSSSASDGSPPEKPPDGVDAMPADIQKLWSQCMQVDSFSRVVAQAAQPPFSDAYRSGDATGSHRAPQLPPPEEFLPLRWRKTVARCDAIDETPEPPEHLSRAYLAAFLRDLGQHTGNDPCFQSVPNSAERYPNLTQLTRLFGRRSGGAEASSPAAAEDAVVSAPADSVSAAAGGLGSSEARGTGVGSGDGASSQDQQPNLSG